MRTTPRSYTMVGFTPMPSETRRGPLYMVWGIESPENLRVDSRLLSELRHGHKKLADELPLSTFLATCMWAGINAALVTYAKAKPAKLPATMALAAELAMRRPLKSDLRLAMRECYRGLPGAKLGEFAQFCMATGLGELRGRYMPLKVRTTVV